MTENTASGQAGQSPKTAIYVFWFVLALPLIGLLANKYLLHGKPNFFVWTGEISTWLLIVSMLVTPLKLMLGPLPWLQTRRRHIGVAAFFYGLAHLAFWLKEVNAPDILRSFARLEVLTGWIAMAIFTALAVTSTDGWVRKLGTGWKTLHYWVYPAAVLTFLHWVMTRPNTISVYIYFAPLLVLSVWRIIRYRRRARNV